MKRTLMMVGVLVASAFASQAAMADAGLDLAKAKNCLACHAVSTKVVGPAYKDVAAKYAGQKGIEDKLVAKVMKGGSASGAPSRCQPIRRSMTRKRTRWSNGCCRRSNSACPAVRPRRSAPLNAPQSRRVFFRP